MHKIKFSHEYHKFPFSVNNMDRVVLLEVLTSKTEDLSDAFIKYDTEIKTPRNVSLPKYYDLPRGDILILILQTTHEIWDGKLFGHQSSGLFTTIRRWTPEKEKYYRSIRGEQVKIEIEEK